MAQKSPKSSQKVTLLDKKFWQSFAKNNWEKKELVARNVKSGLLEMSDAEIFNLLVLFSDRCREQNNPEGFKFFIEGVKAEPEDVLQVLPEKSDKSLLGYHKRMNSMFKDYCLVCDELLQVNLEKQHLLTEFTNALYSHVGFPNRFSEMGLYLGNYKKTPFGVHVDSCGVFSFPVAGVKRFRLWSPEFVEKNPALERAFQYEKYKKNSLLLEAHPGDMTYWPSSAWHIAESDGSFSATWSLGVWVDQPHQDMVSASLRALLDKKSGAMGAKVTTAFKTLHTAQGEVTALPEAYAKSVEILKNLTAEELEETFLKSWTRHISSQGFKTIPGKSIKLSAKAKIKLRSQESKILWLKSKTEKDIFTFSFAGALVESRNLLPLIKALNTGKACLITQFLQGNTLKQDLSALQILAEAGALSLVGTATSIE